MTATLHNFADYRPAALRLSPSECARLEVMSAARAILRSRHRHSDHVLAWACHTIKDYADPSDPDELCDVLQADEVLLEVRTRRRPLPVTLAHVSPRRGSIRLALLDMAALLLFAVAVGLVFLVGAG